MTAVWMALIMAGTWLTWVALRLLLARRQYDKYERAMIVFATAYAENRMGIAKHDLLAGRRMLHDQLPLNYRKPFMQFSEFTTAAERYELNESGDQWKI